MEELEKILLKTLSFYKPLTLTQIVLEMEKDEIGDYFPEFFALKSECKFNNCLHLDEPKCAVKQALKEGDIAWSRYRSYAQMVLGEDESYRVDVYKDN